MAEKAVIWLWSVFFEIYGGGITPLLDSEGKVVISKRKY